MALSQDDYMAARLRRLEANAMIARGDPGRFSPFERNALLGMQHTKGGDIAYVDRGERTGLQRHEMDMLKQTGENEFRVAEQKRFGMKEQGSDAAKWGFKGEEIKSKTTLKQAEIDAATRTKIAELDTEARKYGADRKLEEAESQHGYFDDKGVYHPGGNVAATKAEGQTTKGVAEIQQRGAEAVAAQQARIAAAQQAKKETRQDSKLREELIQKYIKNMLADKNGKYRKMMPEQLRTEAEKMVTVGGLGQFKR